MSSTCLLISSDEAVRRQVERAAAQLEAALEWVETVEAGMARMNAQSPDLVVLDVAETADAGGQVFGELRAHWPRLCGVLIADRAQSDRVINAMKHGAIDYLLKSLDNDELIRRMDSALRIARDMTVPTVYEHDESEEAVARIIGQSPAMHEVFKLIGMVAPRDVNVLVTGESGTGKELIAKALYHHSRRKDGPFLAVNCAAIPETLLESELFGHEKGAFTGADVRRIGKFEQCSGGTLFLDEIGDMPLATQAKLLRVLQDGTFQRLGGTATIRCDVRIVAATNQPIEAMVSRKQFRQDLFYRLNVSTIQLPPLREREVDVVLLAHAFVKRFNPELGTHVARFDPQVLPVLLTYPWPGNVRELENVVKSSLVVARGNVLRLEHLPEPLRAAKPADGLPAWSKATSSSAAVPAGDWKALAKDIVESSPHHGKAYQVVIEAAERAVLAAALRQSNGQIAGAARLLGLTRTTLRKKIASLNIQIETSING